MQRMISHNPPLPACANGHAARHMHDQRAAHAGGGHFIECACRQTQRHPSLDAALPEWQRLNGFVATPHRARVVDLRAGGAGRAR